VDCPKELTCISLCTGYEGIGLGIERAGTSLKPLAYVEIEAFACANLVAKMEAGVLAAAPIWTDIKTFDGGPFRDRVDLVTGGYPCQPFSSAGKRKGKGDPRHLWPYIREIIKAVRPVFCFFENVDGHLSLGFAKVQSSLRHMGYRVEAGLFTAAEAGAPHRRKRLFILGYCKTGRFKERDVPVRQGRSQQSESNINGAGEGDVADHAGRENDKRVAGNLAEKKRQEGCSNSAACTGSADMAIASSSGLERHAGHGTGCLRQEGEVQEQGRSAGQIGIQRWPAGPGPQYGWEPPRVVGNAGRKPRRRRESNRDATGQKPKAQDDGQDLGDTKDTDRRAGECGTEERVGENEQRGRGSGESDGREVESALGGAVDGSPDRLDYARLCVSCDSRIDELRLLGNGVVPQTAGKAWTMLMRRM